MKYPPYPATEAKFRLREMLSLYRQMQRVGREEPRAMTRKTLSLFRSAIRRQCRLIRHEALRTLLVA